MLNKVGCGPGASISSAQRAGRHGCLVTYSRPDVFQLRFNPRPNHVVVSDKGNDKKPQVEITEPSNLVPVDEAPLQRV